MTIDRRVTRLETKQLIAQWATPIAIVVIGGLVGWILTLMNANIVSGGRKIEKVETTIKEVLVSHTATAQAFSDFFRSYLVDLEELKRADDYARTNMQITRGGQNQIRHKLSMPAIETQLFEPPNHP